MQAHIPHGDRVRREGRSRGGALDPRSGLGGGLFGDADQDQGEEAQGDMGPDAV